MGFVHRQELEIYSDFTDKHVQKTSKNSKHSGNTMGYKMVWANYSDVAGRHFSMFDVPLVRPRCACTGFVASCWKARDSERDILSYHINLYCLQMCTSSLIYILIYNYIYMCVCAYLQCVCVHICSVCVNMVKYVCVAIQLTIGRRSSEVSWTRTGAS